MSEGFSELKWNKINSISRSFCAAKWLQVTVDLVTGTTHSCHHPQRHLVPIEELEKDVSALHNTNFKKQQRKLMLDGVRPKECSYCWDVEDIGEKYSDRYIKSTDSWAWDQLDSIAQTPWDQNIQPKYLEVMLDNLCNFSCSYCMATVSTGVAAELKKFGQYSFFESKHRAGHFSRTPEERKIFADAFDKWLNQICSNLKVLRITGGEPLITPLFWKMLDTIEALGNENLQFIVNTHLNHTEPKMLQFTKKIDDLLQKKKINSVEIYTSLDTYGDQAEYIRHGLDYQLVLKNISNLYAWNPNVRVVVMCTFNILSAAKFDLFLQDIIELKQKYSSLVVDISGLKAPEYLRADIHTPNILKFIENSVNFMKKNSEYFSEHEINKLKRTYEWCSNSKRLDKLNIYRADFYKFINEYDKRKGKTFLNIFPEYKDFYIECKKAVFENFFNQKSIGIDTK